MKRIKVSNNVIRRLPRYLRKLDELNAEGVERISSGELGRQLGLTPSQIRQDFSCFGEFGQQGYGYSVGKHILYGYLPAEHAKPGTQVEVQYFGKRYCATVTEEPLFDPTNSRMKV